jgi:hypothetical protein
VVQYWALCDHDNETTGYIRGGGSSLSSWINIRLWWTQLIIYPPINIYTYIPPNQSLYFRFSSSNFLYIVFYLRICKMRYELLEVVAYFTVLSKHFLVWTEESTMKQS